MYIKFAQRILQAVYCVNTPDGYCLIIHFTVFDVLSMKLYLFFLCIVCTQVGQTACRAGVRMLLPGAFGIRHTGVASAFFIRVRISIVRISDYI